MEFRRLGICNLIKDKILIANISLSALCQGRGYTVEIHFFHLILKQSYETGFTSIHITGELEA